jgi:hydrophobic/amphiphilic exporter-1 (mainly G- bacteria), HAE1 family
MHWFSVCFLWQLPQEDHPKARTGLAWVIIGGLSGSLILTLILVPIVYVSVENFRTYIGKKRSRKVIQEKDAAAENP